MDQFEQLFTILAEDKKLPFSHPHVFRDNYVDGDTRNPAHVERELEVSTWVKKVIDFLNSNPLPNVESSPADYQVGNIAVETWIGTMDSNKPFDTAKKLHVYITLTLPESK